MTDRMTLALAQSPVVAHPVLAPWIGPVHPLRSNRRGPVRLAAAPAPIAPPALQPAEQATEQATEQAAAQPVSATQNRDEIVGYIPALRIFARSLCRNPVEADDLVQETLVRGIEKIDQFRVGTNLRAWLFTIMRNRFYTNWAKRARERPGDADCVSSLPASSGDGQFWHLRLREMEAALGQLPLHYRETIILVTVLGESYLQAAEILGCDIGTVKSRVSRARRALRAILDEPE